MDAEVIKNMQADIMSGWKIERNFRNSDTCGMEINMDDMERMDKVEKLREKTGVTYEDAKAALDACGWDMLDAVVYLEKLGKVKAPEETHYSTQAPKPPMTQYAQQYRDYQNTQSSADKKTFSDYINAFFRWCADTLRKGNENYLCAEKTGSQMIRLPITVFVILLVVGFWPVVIVMLIGLFMGFRYSIQGKDIKDSTVDSVNDFMDKAADKADDIREDIFNGGNNSDR